MKFYIFNMTLHILSLYAVCTLYFSILRLNNSWDFYYLYFWFISSHAKEQSIHFEMVSLGFHVHYFSAPSLLPVNGFSFCMCIQWPFSFFLSWWLPKSS